MANTQEDDDVNATWQRRALAYNPFSFLPRPNINPLDYPPPHYESRDNAGQWSTSSSPVSGSRSKNGKATSCINRRRLIIALCLGLTFALVVACGITIPILLMKGDKSSEVTTSFTEYEVSLRIDNIEYIEGMGSRESEDFKRTAASFCGGIDNLFVSSSSGNNYEGCVINELRNGSVVVDFLLVVNDVTTTEDDIMATLSQNLTDNDSVVMNGYWYKPSSITLGSITISATSQLSTGIKVNIYFFSNSVSVPVANEMSFVNNCSCMHSSIPLGSTAVSATSHLSTVSCGRIPSIQNGIVEASGTNYGDVLNISCNEGYTVNGSSQLTCNTANYWGLTSSCQINQCEAPNILAHVTALNQSDMTYSYGSNLTLSCNEGYSLEGDPDIHCQANGSWTTLPECRLLSCPSIALSENSLSNDSVQTNYTEALSVKITCEEGYEMVLLKTCSLENGWIDTFECEPVTCDQFTPSGENHIENVTETGLSYGSNMTIRCKEGYEIDGKREIEVTCLSNKKWSQSPDCRPINCGQINTPKHAVDISTYNSNLNDKVNLSCQDGYDLQGDSEVVCQSNGTWTTLPICVPVSCGDVTDVANGDIVLTSGSNFNDYAIFNCDVGYTLTGNMSIICQANGIWSPQPTCEPVFCEEMTVENGSVNGTSAKFGETIQVTCDTGFRMDGNSIITCQATKTWSEDPKCEKVVCNDNLTLSDNSYLPCKETTSEFGGYLELQCMFGYEIKDGDNKINCLENGSWSNVPECSPIICPRFTFPNNSKTSDIEDKIYVYNDTVVIQCLENHELTGSETLSCLGDGSWSKRPTCEPITCPKVDTPEHAIFQPNMPEEAVVGEQFTVECENGFTVTGNTSFTCLSNGIWSRIADCLPIQCSMLQLPDNSFVESGSLNESFFNDEVTIDCNAGYEIQGNVTVTCLADESWSMLPACTKKVCPNYNLTDNAYIEQNNTGTPPKFRENLVLNCLTGYILMGNATTVCLEDQTWSSYPTCEIVKCPEKIHIDNGHVEVLLEKDREYGDVAQAICDEGFERTDNLTIGCTSNGTWKVDGSCEIVNCPEYNNTVQNRIMKNETGTTYGSRIYFECNDNYIVIGPNPIYCQANKTWQDGPTCLLSACGPTNDVENGFIRSINDTTFEVVCELGYYVNGTSIFSCESGNNLTDIPSCQAVDCGPPTPISNGRTRRSTGTTFGHITSFECEAGYEMTGNSNVSCLATGVWDNLPSCDQIYCGIPPQLVYGRYVGNELNTTLNSTLIAECAPGYIVRDSVSATTCLQTSQWSYNLECIPIECPTLAIDNGRVVSLTDENRFGSVVSVACDDGFTRETCFGSTRCNESGIWENSESCNPVDCGTPESPANGKLEPYTLTTYNTRVYLSCDSGFMLHGANYSACELDGKWSSNFSCDTIDCGDINSTFDGDFIKATTTFNSLAIAACNNGDAIPLICGHTGNWLLYATNAPFTKDVCNVTDEVNCGLPVAVENGKYKFISGIKTLDYATAECNIGYEMVGNETIVCEISGNWSTYPMCSIVDCGNPYPPANARHFSEGPTTYGSKSTIECIEGFVRQTNESMVCESDGYWTSVPGCVIDCGSYEMVQNGKVKFQNGTGLQSVVKVECEPGFHLFNESMDMVVCTQYGKWEGDPYCIDTDPGKPYMHCLEKDVPEAVGENVTIDCLLRDVDTIDSLVVAFNGDEIYSQTYANTPDNIVIGNGERVTISFDSDKMVVGFQVNCQTEGTYIFRVNDHIEDTLDVQVISNPTIEEFGTPQDVYLNQRTIFTCAADLGRNTHGDSLVDLVFEKIMDDGLPIAFSDEYVTMANNNSTCLNVVTATLTLYPDTSYNNTLIRCTLANSTHAVLTTDTYQVAILESDLFFIEGRTSKTVLIGDDLILHCNVKHVVNFEMMIISKGQDILSTLYKNGTVVSDLNSIGSLTSYDAFLKINISSAECSTKGTYICSVFSVDGEDISTVMEVKMARLPVHPDFILTIDVIENKIPWASYPTLCSGSLGYPMGVMYLETNVNGDFTVLDNATFLYSNNDEECTASGNLTYFNMDRFNMSWDGTEMRCVVENGGIYEYTYMLFVSRTVEIIPVSICQGQTPNTHFEHPYACHSAITCENEVPLPVRYICKDDECYNWDTRLCTPCENLKKCKVPTPSVPTTPPPTQTLDCPRQVQVSKDETVNISCLVTNDVILLTNLTTWYLHIQHDGNTMLDTRDDVPTTDNEEKKIYTLTDGYVVEVSRDMVQLTTTLNACNKSGVYIIEYVKNFTLQRYVEIVVTAPVREPQMSMTPTQLYRNQLITVTCSGHVGNPPSALSLVSTADLTTEITVDQVLDEDTCGYLETVTHEFYVRDFMENATLMCETALVNGTSIVSNQEEIAVSEPVIMFDVTHSTSLIGSPYVISCRWDISIDFDRATIRRRSFTASQFEDTLTYDTADITNNLPGTSGNIQTFTTQTTLYLSIESIDCEYDGEYLCDLELGGTLLGRTQMFLYATDTRGPSSLTLPIQLVTNTPTLQMQDYLECVADVGYRNTYDIRFEYYDTSTNEYETFNLGSELSLINQTFNCRTTLTTRRQAITFDESWEGAQLRCAVFDTSTGDVVASSQTQTVRLLEDHCDGLNDETFGCHPYNCSMYTRCHSSGYLSVLSCQPGQCVVIRNRPFKAAECRYDCTDVVGTPCCP